VTALRSFLPEIRVDFDGVPEAVLLNAVRSACIEFCDKTDYVEEALSTIKIAPNISRYLLSPPSASVEISSLLRARHDGIAVRIVSEQEIDRYLRSTSWRTQTGDKPERLYRSATNGSSWYVHPVPYTATADATGNITSATQANPVVIGSTAHGRSTGDRVYISGVVGMTAINGIGPLITVVDANSFSLDGVDGTGYSAYTSGGTWSYNDGLLDVVVSTKPTRTASTVADAVYIDFYEAILHGARRRLFSMPDKPWFDARVAGLHESAFREQIRDARTKRREGDADRSSAALVLPTPYVVPRPSARRGTDFEHED
jgi:hypothetical protein